MEEKKETPLVRLIDTGEPVFPVWTDLGGDTALNQDRDIAKILARVIEQWLYEDENPTLH